MKNIIHITNGAKYRLSKVFLFIISILGFVVLPNVVYSTTKSNAKKIKPKVVPKRIRFAGMKLYLTDTARARVQDKVDSLMRSPVLYQALVDRANLYFPIFESILKKQGVPEELKFLAIQESTLISDCVSETKDVGIWAFQDYTAKEVGLRVDRKIDERCNVYSSTVGMSKFMKKNYDFFQNWIHTLIAYNMGRTGATNVIRKHNLDRKGKVSGSKMEICGNTPQYVIHFLAHLIAFQKSVGKNKHPKYKLHVHEINAGSNFDKVAKKFKLEKDIIENYNKWLLCRKVPHGERYKMIVPIPHNSKIPSFKRSMNTNTILDTSCYKNLVEEVEYPIYSSKKDKYGNIINYVNDIKGEKAQEGDTVESMAQKGKISIDAFMKYNDMKEGDTIKVGYPYYYEYKNSKGRDRHYIVKKKETWWSVSQKLGIKLDNLVYFNFRNKKPKSRKIKKGRLLWIKYLRPKNTPKEYVEGS